MRVHKIAKAMCFVAVCLSVCPHGTTLLPLGEFPLRMVLEDFF